MSIIRKTRTSVIIAMSLAMLAACGGGGGGDGTPVSDGTPIDTTPTPPPPTNNDTATPPPTDNTVFIAPQASYAYITQRGWFNQDGSILKCKVDNGPDGEGALTECTDSGAGTLPGPISLTFVGNRAYVVNKRVGAVERVTKWEDINYTHSIWMCSLNQADGTLSGCANTGEKESVHIDDFFIRDGSGFMLQKYGDMILREGVNSDGTIGLIKTIENIGLREPVNYAVIPEKNRTYIANSSLDGSSITLCNAMTYFMDTDGLERLTISGCGDANASSFRLGTPGITDGVQPTGIAINDKGSMAYIVSQANKNVISCNVGSGGRFTSCAANSLDVSVDTLNRVAIQDKYVYVTNTSHEANTGSLIKCEVATNGTLTDCKATGQGFDSGDLNPSIPHNSDGSYTAIDSSGSDIKFLYSVAQQ